ncbi:MULTISPECIES: outer membrane protein assembly factor BamE [Agarivorans]|uniref:Outer membrane protein assembly factor BamE n=1 Tax=Agarivorans albus MKT 106 TaxID=1331007 RepID=R9PN18_AGAAL|nr:outer membrane protein assembly factor BamE [Agarivorans albus]GAD02673.1 component of the essential YaeT outer-membrane protein assembly complex [Agarivorans albus MKT 106]
MRFTAKIFVLLASIGLSGCSAFDWMVYKIDIPQGNYIDDAKVEQLRINMTKEQVRFVLGTPMLIDAFDKERWYYLYSYQSGNGDFEKRDLVIQFVNDHLAFIEGDYQVSEDFMQPLDAG